MMLLPRAFGVLALITSVAACGGDDGQEIDARLGASPSATEPSCAEIERFADLLTDVFIEYDTTASRSPAEVAARVDVVLGGRLTGAAVVERIPSDDRLAGSSESVLAERTFVGWEVAVARVVSGDAVAAGERTLVFVEHGVSETRDAHDFGDAAARGAAVAVFAQETRRLGGLEAVHEGFVIGCADGALLGWTGTQGEWTALATVDEVLDAVADASGTGPLPRASGSRPAAPPSLRIGSSPLYM